MKLLLFFCTSTPWPVRVIFICTVTSAGDYMGLMQASNQAHYVCAKKKTYKALDPCLYNWCAAFSKGITVCWIQFLEKNAYTVM